MKRIKYIFVLLLILSLTSCGFVSYVETSSSNVEENIELDDKKKEYINKLDESYNESNYYEIERSSFLSALLEAKAEINECDNVVDIEKCYNDNNEIIKGINTKTYLVEKYTNDINNISNIDIYRDKEKEIYNKYITSALDSINEATSKVELEKILTLYTEIIQSIKTDEQYIEEEIKAFELYKEESITEVNNYVSLSDYREEESKSISTIKTDTILEINSSNDYAEIDKLVREYKIKIYVYKTDKELYNEELSELINQSVVEINNYVNKNDYRNNEVLIIEELFKKYNEELDTIVLKENVISLNNKYKELLDSIKTDKELYSEEKIELVNQVMGEIKNMVNYDSLSENGKCYYDDLKEELLSLNTKENVTLTANNEKIKIREELAQNGDSNALVDIELLYKDNLKYYLDKSLYRDEQKEEIDNIISTNGNEILLCETYNDVLSKVNEVEGLLDDVLTNDEMWEKEDADFFVTLHSLYGDDILTPPSSMTVANDYYELAKIIDYYAFYQLDGDSFVRDRFRIKCEFEIADKGDSIFQYSELVRYTLNYNYYIDQEYIIINLIPSNYANFGNDKTYVKLENMVTYNSGSNEARDESFTSFAYKSCSKKVVAWNSQQLWYALEHNYNILPIENSVCELLLKKCENILRTQVFNDMDDYEKIFTIHKFLMENVTYDEKARWIFSAEERINNAAWYVEGALVNGVAVCTGFAKAYLILLKMEGIDCYLDYYNENNNIHEKVMIRIENELYSSDITHDGRRELSTYRFLLLNEKRYAAIYNNLIYKNYNVFLDIDDSDFYDTINRILDAFYDDNYIDKSISILIKNERKLNFDWSKIENMHNFSYRWSPVYEEKPELQEISFFEVK